MDNSEKRVVVYCRESRDDYGTNYERIETQRDICLRYCEDQGYTNIIDIIMQDDISGTDFSRYEELKQKIKNHEFDVLVMKDSSRFGRNQKDALIFLDLIQENEIELEFATKKFDEDFFGLEAWFNERRAKEDSQKIKGHLKEKMIQGKLLIRDYFGYKKVDGKLIVDEEAAQFVKHIFDLYLQGYGYRIIASMLQNENIPTPSQYKAHGKYPIAKIWRSLHVQRILTNQIYVGDMISGKTEKVSFKSKKTRKISKAKWITTYNNHEAIIDRETFEKVQQFIASKTTFAPKTPKPSPFSSLLICGKCKSPMFIIRSKKIPHAFLCGKYYNEGVYKEETGLGCTSHRVRENELLDIVRKHLENIQDNTYKEELEESSSKYESSQKYIEEMISKTNKELQLLQNQYKQVYNDKLNNIIPEFIFTDKTKEIQEKIDKIEIKLKELQIQQSKVENGINDNNKFYTIMNKVKASGLTKETVQEIIDNIIVFDEGEIQEEDKTTFNISQERFDKVYENGGIIIVYKGIYQHVLTNRWIREHIGTWRERAGMG